MSYLSPEALTLYVQAIAEQPSLWIPHVEHGDKRVYKELASTETFNCWLICWNTGHDTGLHDHDGSSGGVIVVNGTVEETRLYGSEGGIIEQGKVYQIDDTFNFGPWDIHRVRHTGKVPSVTIHAYSPPLDRMGNYGFSESGEFHRIVKKGREELMPLELAVKDVQHS